MGQGYGERPTSHTKGRGVLWGLVPATARGPVRAKSVFSVISLISYGVQMPLTSQVGVMAGWCVHTNFNNFYNFYNVYEWTDLQASWIWWAFPGEKLTQKNPLWAILLFPYFQLATYMWLRIYFDFLKRPLKTLEDHTYFQVKATNRNHWLKIVKMVTDAAYSDSA